MALTMVDKQAETSSKSAWAPELLAEFEREKNNPNPCVGNALVSETDRVRVWTIRLKPGERIGFHRHVLDYFWTAVTGGRGLSWPARASWPCARASSPGTSRASRGSPRRRVWGATASDPPRPRRRSA